MIFLKCVVILTLCAIAYRRVERGGGLFLVWVFVTISLVLALSTTPTEAIK